MNIITTNKKAFYDYTILEKLEVGMVLTGSEVKSLRHSSNSNIDGAYVKVIKDDLLLIGANISPYISGGYGNHTSVHDRKLLCHTKELRKIKQQIETKGLTIVPLKIYEKNGRFKLEIGIAQGKKKADKRQRLKEKDIERESQRYYK